jgi:hypothetical protein
MKMRGGADDRLMQQPPLPLVRSGLEAGSRDNGKWYHCGRARPYKTFGLDTSAGTSAGFESLLGCATHNTNAGNPEGLLGFFEFFRRPPPIRDVGSLADFIDQQSAFLAQKGIYEYARARAGHYAKVLFREETFLQAVEHSRWSAYPLGLAMVAEVVEGILRPHGADRREQLDGLAALVLSVFDRYPTPPTLGEEVWREARTELARRLQLIGLHPPKRAMDVAEPWAESYFNLMPIHEKLRARDYPTTRNYLRVTLINVHDEFSKRMDAAALVSALSATPRTDH